MSTLVGDYYEFDPASQCLVGERTRRVYGLGDVVSVQVSRVDVDERKIDFELVTHSPLTSRRKAGTRRKKKQEKRQPRKRKARRR